MQSKFFTPLRYPGGKAGLGPWVASLMRSNSISGGTYVEPYTGGGGVALYLLINGYVKDIVINDLDPLIYAFWWSVLNDTGNLIERIKHAKVDLKTWEIQKKISNNIKKNSLPDIGYAAFFLNRTNRSGILKGGAIGGKAQSGQYKIDARFNKSDLITRINIIAKHKKFISLHNMDAVDLLTFYADKLDNRSLIYLDPPYYNKGSQLYRNFYKPEDHQKVADAITSIKTPWMVTYDNCDAIGKIYQNENFAEFSLRYSTNIERPMATEKLIYGNLDMHINPILSKSIKPFPKSWMPAA